MIPKHKKKSKNYKKFSLIKLSYFVSSTLVSVLILTIVFSRVITPSDGTLLIFFVLLGQLFFFCHEVYHYRDYSGKFEKFMISVLFAICVCSMFFFGLSVAYDQNSSFSILLLKLTNLNKFHQTLNGIDVYSDINDFSRISELMNNTQITKSEYPHLNAVVYFQGRSNKGYTHQNLKKSCDGYYFKLFNEIVLFKCEGRFSIRESDIKSNFSEEFILGHELGHHLFDTGEGIEEYACDDFSKSLFGVT